MIEKIRPEIKTFRISQLKPSDYNPRTIDDSALEGLTNSIKKFGCVEPIVVNVRNGKNVIVGGHQRYRILRQLCGDSEKIVCVMVNLKKNEERLLNLTLNNPQVQGQFIKELASYIDSLKGELSDDDYLKLKIAELREELGYEGKCGKILDDEIPEPPKKAITKLGDLWLLGKHRLLCGDSTNEKDVARLMGRKKASLFATDPPYCVDYTGKDRPGGGKDWSDVYHETEIGDGKQFYLDFYKIGLKYIKPNTAFYLWHASKRRQMIYDVCNEMGLLVHQDIIWVKPCSILTYSFYSWRHEPCFLIWKKGQKPPYRPKNKSIGTVWPVGYIKTGDPTMPEYYTDVWELDWEGKKRNQGLEHPTVKPVEIFAIPMRVHTKPDDICYEPFCGSGSQIIAAEKLDRRCFAIEMEPIFCDVAVKRWEEWTGKKVKRVKN